MIRNIVFDMGQVLIRFEPDLFLDRLNLSKEDRDLLTDQVFYSMEWVRMDRGELVEADVIASACKRLPEHLHSVVETLVAHWDEPILPMPGMEELIEELKALGYPIYLLSNAALRQHTYWPRIPGSQHFDGKLISADVKLIKPEREIYYLLYKTFGICPEESFFIDDSPHNIEAAFQTGMEGFIFRGKVPPLRKALRERGVPVKE